MTGQNNEIFQILAHLREKANDANELGCAFITTGNKKAGDALCDLAGEIWNDANRIRDLWCGVVRERVRDAEQASQNMLNLALALNKPEVP